MKKCLEIPIEEQGVLMRRLNKASILPHYVMKP